MPAEHLVDAFSEDIRFIYRHFPLDEDPNSPNQFTVRAAEAAGMQGRFFDFHFLLLERQAEWRIVAGDQDALRATLVAYATEIGLDPDQFEQDLDSPETAAIAAESYAHAVAIGLSSTPSVFLDGQPFDPRAFTAPEEQWAEFIEGQKAVANLPKYEKPPMTIDIEKEYLATVETEKGSFVIELYPKSAPVTVNSFIFLANEGYYDGVTFHRVIEGFMAQTGDPSGTGMGGPGYSFEDEIDPDLTFDGAGWVAMANAGPNTNGSQFFITFAPKEHLNGAHTIFGKVIEGMEVVESITPRDPSTGPDFAGDKIISITIEEK